MFLLRRAAVRTLSLQTRQLSTVRPSSTRFTALQSTKPAPALFRPFHQARIWRAEEQEQKTEELKDDAAAAAEGAEDQVSDSAVQEAAEHAEVEAYSNPEPADPTPAQASNIPEQDVASDTQSAAQAASAAASTATSSSAAGASPFQQPQQHPPQGRSPFPGSSSNAAGTSFRNAQPSRILYIGNLFFEVTAAQLETEFSRFGRITNSRVVTDARGLSKGFGYIEFESQAEADTAVRELDQKVFQGRRMAVQYHVRRETRRGLGGEGAARREPNAPSKTLFIGNMSYQMSDRDLNDLFREIRDVLDVRVAIDRRSGQPRGFAHADFIDIPAAQRAKEHLEKKVVYGRQLRVDFSQSSSSTQNV